MAQDWSGKMFSFNAFVNWINRNNDQIVQQSEISDFLKSQKAPSIFTEYFNTINSDVDIESFRNNVANIIEEEFAKGNENIELSFVSKKQAKQFKKFTKEQERLDKQEEAKYWEDTKLELQRRYGWKFKNKDEFNQTFELLKKECQESGGFINEKFNNLPVTHTITNDGFQLSGGYDVELPYNFVMPDMDWSSNPDIFHNLSYYENTFSQTSQEHLPKGYNVQEVFEKGKTIGLGISEAHNSGYSGKGVNYAIIDSGITDHNALKFKENHNFNNSEIFMHGNAVSYIAQEIAPQADCYYYAAWGQDMGTKVIEDLKAILEKNKTLPDDKKIRVISMSMPLYGGEEARQLADELEQQGCWVLTSGKDGDSKKFGYLEKINPNGEVDDFNNYQIAWENNSKNFDNLYISSGDRTVPDPNGEDVFRHDSVASQSWAIPVLAGYYVLACQADPAMNKDKFYQLANQTARVIESTEPIYKGEGDDARLVGRTTDKIQIKVIDINALLQAIENEKSQQAQ